MRILHIVGTMSPTAGGPVEVIRMLVQHAPPGYENEVVTTDAADAPFLATSSFPIHALGEAGKWSAPRLIPWLEANRDRFDGVIVHGLWAYIGVAVPRALEGHVPDVVFPHGMLDPYFKRAHPAKHWKKWPFWLGIEYWNLRQAFRVLFTTALERDLAAESFWLHRWNPMVVPLGTDAPPANTPELLQAFYAHCPAVEGRRFLLYLGRIHPKKGCDLLMQAFAAEAPAAPELHLVMAGPDKDNWRAQLEPLAAAAGASDRVHWPGMLQGDAKWGAFAACEAFILPSHQENFGVAVVEALASGRPALLAHPVNIAPDVAADGAGFAEADTLEGTRSLLQHWLALSPTEREGMGQRALVTFQQRYDMRRNTEAILRVFEQLPSKTKETR